jgi:p-hydroxybenzoate 3-monooxygenase
VRTQVGIIGAGPAGLLLSHLLHTVGIESVVVERRSREYVESRVRAGVLEHGAVSLLRAAGLAERLAREGLVHRGIYLQFGGGRHHIDFVELTGRAITVYGQQEVVKDIIAARLAADGEVLFEAEAERIDGIESERPSVAFVRDGAPTTLECDVVAACDGSFGIGRAAMPAELCAVYERVYPHAWLGILARTPPASEELIYACHERGFALHSMRTPQISRLYLQVGVDDSLDDWPEQRIWEELRIRLDEPGLRSGEIIESGITPMRSMAMEPMQHGRMFLAGDAAHIVPPTGAKGMNLALADVQVLSDALAAWYRTGAKGGLDGYTAACLRRVWRAEHFSSFMTQLLHRDPEGDPFEHKLRLANLDYIVRSRAAATSLAENYTSAATGLPTDSAAMMVGS